MQVIHIDYPLAPENPFPEALEAIFDVYQTLLDQGVQAKDILLAGDSCGANLALALALKSVMNSYRKSAASCCFHHFWI